jgi:hypothetical protein
VGASGSVDGWGINRLVIRQNAIDNWLHCYHASTKRPSRVQRSHDDTGGHDVWRLAPKFSGKIVFIDLASAFRLGIGFGRAGHVKSAFELGG